MVLSIIAYSLLPSAARCRKTRSDTPALAQRLNRRCVFFRSPKRSARSRDGIPARYLYRLDKATIVAGGGTDVAPLAGKQVLNPFPLVVAKSIAGHASAFYKADSA
jgi:hypothetical protein